MTPRQASLRPMHLPPRVDTRLSNGLRAVVMKWGQVPIVSVRLLIRCGSAMDPADKLGLAGLLARVLRRGTRKHPGGAFNQQLEQVGANLTLTVREDDLAVQCTMPSERLPEIFPMVGELVSAPSLADKELQSARRRCESEIARQLDDPSDLASRAVGLAAWGKHPYGHTTEGKAAHLARVHRVDLVRHLREHFGPRVTTAVVVGHVDPEATVRLAERSLASLRGGPEAPRAVPPRRGLEGAGQVWIVDRPDQTQAQVRVVARGVALGSPRHFSITAISTVLGDGFTSRLMQAVRVKRGLSYGARAKFESMVAGGLFVAESFTQVAKARELVNVMLGEIDRLRQEGMSAVELARATRHYAGTFPSRVENTSGLVMATADQVVYGRPDDWVEKYRERLCAVTRAEAIQAARDFLLDPSREEHALVVVGPARRLARQLERFGRVRVFRAAAMA